MTKLTPEQQAALSNGPVVCVDEATDRRFVLIEEDVHRRAMEALRRQDDREAIETGIADKEAGRVRPFAEVDARIRKKLGLPPRP